MNEESTIMEKLNYLEGTKTSIKNAIINKGQDIDETTTFREYAAKIAAIETGTDTSDATATANDIINPKTAYVNGEKVIGAIMPNYVNTGMPSVSVDCIYNDNSSITSSSFKHKIAVTYNSGNARIYKILGTGYLSTEYTTVTVTDVAGEDSSNRVLNYSGIADELIDKDNGIVNVYFLANSSSTGIWMSDIIVGICEVNINTLEVIKITKLKITGMGPYAWYGGNIHPRPHSADCVFFGFSGQSNGSCQQYMGIARNPETGEYSARYSNWGDTWNRGDRQRNTTIWSDGGDYCYTSNNKWNRLFKVSADGYTWTQIVSNNLNKPIPLNNNISILGNNLYNTETGSLIGIAPNNLSIDASTENYVISNGYLFIQATGKIQVYSVSSSGINYLGEIANVTSILEPDGSYLQIKMFNTNGIIYLIKTIDLEKLLTSFTLGGKTYYNTTDADAQASNILSGKIAYSANSKMTGSMPNNGALNYTPSTSQQTIPAGYTSGGTVSAVTSSIDNNIQAANIKKNVTILGVTGSYEGTDTSDANATVDDILEGKTAYVNGVKLTGTLVPAEDLSEELTAQQTKIEELEALLQHKCDFQFKIYDTVAHMEEAEAQEGDKAVVYTENSNTFNFEGFYRYDGSDWIKLSPNITTTDLDNANSQVENLLS